MTNGASNSKKKGLGPLGWVLIGCGGVLVLAGVAFMVLSVFVFKKAKDFSEDFKENPVPTLAKGIAFSNPDIDYVGSDEEKETVTFLNNKTGKEITVDYRDIKEGKLTFSSGDETVSFDASPKADGRGGGLSITTNEMSATYGADVDVANFPDWVPVFPGSTPRGTAFAKSPDGTQGSYTIVSDESLEKLRDYYTKAFEQEGLEAVSQTTTPDGSLSMLGSQDGARGATLVTSTNKEGQSQVVVGFTEKKQ